MKRHNISLIGMAACGKSTAGVLLAKTLGMMFVDTDLLIQQKAGMLLAEILSDCGIRRFLEIEDEVIRSLDVENTCVATGGSVVYSTAAMEYLREISTIVYLAAPYDVIARRIGDIKGRGVVIEPGKSLYEVYREREPLYRQYADVVVDTSGLGTEMVVTEITEQIKNEP